MGCGSSIKLDIRLFLDDKFDDKIDKDSHNGYSLNNMTKILESITQNRIPAAEKIYMDLQTLKRNYELAVWEDEVKVADAEEEEEVKHNPQFKTWISNMRVLYGTRKGEGSKHNTARKWNKDPTEGSYILRQEGWIATLKAARDKLVISIAERAIFLEQLPAVKLITGVDSTAILRRLVNAANKFRSDKKIRRVTSNDASILKEVYVKLLTENVQSRIDGKSFYFY